MIAALVAFAVIGLVLALVVVAAKDPGPDPGEVALAYELAWDRLDFESLWTLSDVELRDGRSRAEFIADKRHAYEGRRELAGLVSSVTVEEVVVGFEVAVVRTRVESRDGSAVRNQVNLTRRDGAWRVVGYELQPDTPASRPAS